MLVVGGGRVGTRKALAFHDAGATVRVISPEVTGDLAESGRMAVERRSYGGRQDIGPADIVIAATGDHDTDVAIASDARALGRLVNVAGDPDAGNFTSMAVHRAGELTIAVTTGRVPAAAVRIRDSIAMQFGERYARAIDEIAELRARILAEQGQAEWARVNAMLLGADFCSGVDGGRIGERVAACR